MATRQQDGSSARRARATVEVESADGRPRVLVVDEDPPTPQVAVVMEALVAAGVTFETVVLTHGRADRAASERAMRYDVVIASPRSGALGVRPPAPPNGDMPDVDAGRLRIDGQRRTVVVDGVLVPMSAREYTLLHYLASRPNVVFTREALLLAVWGSSWRTEGSVTEYVRRVRMLLEPHGVGRCIVTRKGFGYAFDPDGVN